MKVEVQKGNGKARIRLPSLLWETVHAESPCREVMAVPPMATGTGDMAPAPGLGPPFFH